MSKGRYGGGDVWSPLFSITEEEKNNFLQNYKKWKTDKESLCGFVFDALYKHGYDYTDNDILNAIKISLLKMLVLNSDFAFDILGKDIYEKARDDFEKCEYDSEALKEVIKLFNCAWGNIKRPSGKPIFMDCSHIYPLLKDDISFYHSLIKSNQIENKYAPLKVIIDTICTVDYECYLNNEKDKTELDGEINTYIIDTYGYDFNQASKQTEYTHSEYFKNKVNEVLQLALLNDKEFWKDKTFLVTSFLNQVYKKSKDNAKSIIDYIFKNLQEKDEISLFIKNGLSIGFSLEILKKKQKEYANLNGFSEEIAYPLYECDESIINEGKKIFESFLYEYIYPHCKENVKELLAKKIRENDLNDVFAIINNATVGINVRGYERNALYVLNKEFFSGDAIYKRAYIKSYYLSKLSTHNEVNHRLFECFYYLIEELNRTLNVESSIQLDSKLRKEKFNLLKNILSNYGANIEYNDDYVVSMVDNKSATVRETRRFSSLQDLGSAIYDFALAELIFYNPYLIAPEYEHDKYSDYKSKIEIAKKINLNEAYICHVRDKHKFIYDISKGVLDFTKLNDLARKEKYLSDFLEMLLGAYSFDKGHNEAISLAKTLIIDTFPDVFAKNDNIPSANEERKEYINSYLEVLNLLDCKYEYFNIIHRCLYNLLGSLVLKNGAEKTGPLSLYTPDRIAPLFGDTRFFTEITPPFRCYLENGIDGVIGQYGKVALENFKNKKA